jgi:hypothetical protein
MSSIAAAYSQVPPRSRYIVNTTAAQTGIIYDVSGSSLITGIAADTVLQDMGVTVVLTGGLNVLRKVQLLPILTDGRTGYIYIDGAVPTGQNISRLN